MKPPDQTSTKLARIEPTGASALARTLPEDKVQRVMTQFFARRSPGTIEGYRQDLVRFAEYLELCDRGASKELREEAIAEATRYLFSLPAVDASYIIMQYMAWLGDKKVAPATINRRLAALKSLVKLGQMLGAVSWSLNVRGVKTKKMRDVRGPTVEQVRQMMEAARAQVPKARAARDAAMLSMFFVLGLRGVEVRELHLEHVEWKEKRVLVRGKGRTERAPQTLPDYVIEALREWMKHRGEGPGPLFVSISRRKSTAEGLTRAAVWSIVSKLGTKVGIRAWPHGLRHSAITETLEMSDGDVRSVRQFSRHERVQTVMDYDDARRDVAGSLATKLSERLKSSTPPVPHKE